MGNRELKEIASPRLKTSTLSRWRKKEMTPPELLLHAIERGVLDDPQAIDQTHATDNQAHAWPLDEEGAQPAFYAAQYGRIRMLRRLIQLGCDVNHCDQYGRSALMVASGMGHLDVVRLLLDHNALIEQQTTGGWRALSIAAGQGHIDICRLLRTRQITQLITRRIIK